MNAYMKSILPRYRGYLNPKHLLPRESIVYHMGSVFLSFLVFLMLFYFNVDPIIACGINVLLSLVVFLSLFRVNNHFYARDKFILEQMIVSHRIDAMKLLSAFYSELQQMMQQSNVKGEGGPDIIQIPTGDITPLFHRVFREHSGDLIYLFKSHEENFFRFLEVLTPHQREMLYRHYLIKEEFE